MTDLHRVASFYAAAFDMTVTASDEYHCVLGCRGFKLIVHQIPKHIADGIVIEQPPRRRESAAVRLDYRVASIEESRRLARLHGGSIDDRPPAWAGADAHLFFGHDPEGNQFGVIDQARRSELVGCGAVKLLKHDILCGEIKRLFVFDAHDDRQIRQALSLLSA